ncbi:hypothetical protein ABAC460_04885 [Asticcacaulis sp. AC460]|uniref:DUF6491 family protein n=1 Tax=Asticcacaulis sp. AC460 TaxID=1282360 RepID=UPI0003C3AD9F|nr:DUF6491 family protein [Asticcacaulis sp. AC460]ESQ92229.1 hypothetical protein ABAC460_04885 [Asticcacaulis sp. AC460]
MLRNVIFGFAGAGVAVVVLTGATLAGDGERSDRVAAGQCVSRPLDQTKIIDDETLYVDDRGGRAVLLHMSGACLFNSFEPVGLEFHGGAMRICDPLDVDVTGSVTTMPTRCIIRSVEALTPERAAEYRRRR